jgi:hypothetical protein
MHATPSDQRLYLCPIYSDLRPLAPGTCLKCGMAFVEEGRRFGLLRHILGSPQHVTVMLALMTAVMAGAMIVMR